MDNEWLRWPLPGDDPLARTTLTCGHFALLAEWGHPTVGQGQHCEVCDDGRTIVEVSHL